MLENGGDDAPTVSDAGLLSLRALGRAAAGLTAAWMGILLVTGNALAQAVVPVLLALSAVGFGVAVFRVDPRPRTRWRGTAITVILMGVLVLLLHFQVLPLGR